jgi:hypothetical protein
MVGRLGTRLKGSFKSSQVQALETGAVVARKFKKPLGPAPGFLSLPLPLASLVPRFLANERAAVFVCDWAPLAGHSHQTLPRLASTVQYPSTSTLAINRSTFNGLPPQWIPGTPGTQGTQGTPKRQGPGSPARRHLVSLRLLFMGALSQEQASQLSGVR